MKKQNFFLLVGSILAGVTCLLLISDSDGTIKAAEKSVQTCLNVIIPSLFAFMVFSKIVVKSGIADIALYPFYKISSFWFKGSRREFSIFILSLIGGYPIGIRLLNDHIAYNKNYTEIAENMLCYCYCGSPSFIIQIAGLSVTGNAEAGFIVYLSNALSCLTAAVFINIFSKRNNAGSYQISKEKMSFSDITDSIGSSVKSLGIICGTILAFNIILELLDYIGFIQMLKAIDLDKIMSAGLEISNLSLFNGCGYGFLPLISAITSLGGICILVQTAALSENKISLKKFIVSRIPIAFLSSIYSYLILLLFPVSLETYLPSNTVTVLSSVNPVCSVCIAVMSYILLKQERKEKDV